MKKRRAGRHTIVFLTCVLAVPTVGVMTGAYAPSATLEQLTPALAVGALLGAAHLLLRPLLRLVSAPLGCLTLGLFGLVIDIALLYGCAGLVEGYARPDLLGALMTTVLINAVCAVAGGRR